MPASAPAVRVRAFAKINLTLRVVGVRADGYHELRTTFQSLALHDTLTFTLARGPFQIACDDPACPVDRTNLVWRAADEIWRAAGRRGEPSGVRARIEKRIPLAAGIAVLSFGDDYQRYHAGGGEPFAAMHDSALERFALT